jgi:hypothetical protein
MFSLSREKIYRKNRNKILPIDCFTVSNSHSEMQDFQQGAGLEVRISEGRDDMPFTRI